jgi:hypothetical protein
VNHFAQDDRIAGSEIVEPENRGITKKKEERERASLLLF